jgi:TonB family protein
LDRPFQYLERAAEPEGTALGVGVSLTLHVAVLLVIFFGMREAAKDKEEPIRFVQLVPQLSSPAARPRTFTEAPGAPLEQAPSPAAPLSDANRRASAPAATGNERTARPGDGSGGLHVPGASSASPGAQAARPHPATPPSTGATRPDETAAQAADDRLAYRIEAARRQGSSPAAPPIDWNSAIRDAARAQPAGTGGRVGGEKGFAESGPISFETQWYDWGPYAAAMVAKIRLHWYQNMPEVIRLGLKGVVVIRFTIQRDGRITDITTLESSGVPPFDYAAAKAIELASPLSPLPKDFPEPDERVTAAFYYNMTPPGR